MDSRTGTEQNKETVRRQFELQNVGDAKGAAALWASDASNHGRRVDQKMMESVFATLHSLQEQHSIHEMVAEGEWVAVRTTCEGLHAVKPALPVNNRMFEGVEPSGRKYTAQHMHFFRIIDGKIKEHWANRDDLGAARQIGLELRPSKT